MAIEIKGLKLQAMTARGHLDRMTKAYAKFNEAAPAHAADVEGMAEQVTEMQSDLEFATNLLGNSPAVSGNGAAEKPKERPIEKKVTEAGEIWTITLDADAARGKPAERPNIEATDSDANQPKATAEPPLVRLGPNPSQQEAGETPATTFHDL